MPIHIITIENTIETDAGLRLLPGIPINDGRAEVGQLIQGCSILLKTPDQKEIMTTLVTYGIAVQKSDDGGFVMSGEPKIELTVAVKDIVIPVGTEVWIGYVLQ
jgi:hypothetical protein